MPHHHPYYKVTLPCQHLYSPDFIYTNMCVLGMCYIVCMSSMCYILHLDRICFCPKTTLYLGGFLAHGFFANGFLFPVKELGFWTNPGHWVRVLDAAGSYMYFVL
jgi:hypothetical protein